MNLINVDRRYNEMKLWAKCLIIFMLMVVLLLIGLLKQSLNIYNY
jgi:hypothetical protein